MRERNVPGENPGMIVHVEMDGVRYVMRSVYDNDGRHIRDEYRSPNGDWLHFLASPNPDDPSEPRT